MKCLLRNSNCLLVFIDVSRWIFDAACPVFGAVNVGIDVYRGTPVDI